MHFKNWLKEWFSSKPNDPLTTFVSTLISQHPTNIELYREAFTHSSSVENNKSAKHNEKLEFLGDSILDAIIADILMTKYPNKREGELTQIRARIVNRKQLNKIALEMNFLRFIKSSSVKTKESSIPGNTLEAFIGAVYLDKGFAFCKQFVSRVIVDNHLNLELLEKKDENFKSALLEWSQKENHTIKWEHKQKTIDGLPVFEAALLLNGKHLTSAKGKSKKIAEQLAAKIALNQIDL